MLALQVFVTRELFYYVADIWRLAPTPARRASKKNKRFVSSRNTWSDHVAKVGAIPLNNSFQKNYEYDFMSDQAGRLIFPKIAFD